MPQNYGLNNYLYKYLIIFKINVKSMENQDCHIYHGLY